MDLGLQGRVALVTGASRGIGRATAEALARAGARVAMCARGGPALEVATAVLKEQGAEVLARTADVSREEDVRGLVQDVVERWGGLDVVVNNAGGPPPGSFDECGESEWRSAIDLTLLSVIRTARAALPHLRASGQGRLINVLSTTIKEPQEGMLLSNSLRSAVAGLAKTLSREVGPHGVTVNNVCPGHVMTARLREIGSYRARHGGPKPADVLNGIPLRRLGSPDEVADLIVFLASSRAAYITGATIPVDGGSTVSLT